MQIGLSEENMKIMINEVANGGLTLGSTGVDLEAYFSIMKSCTLF
jgi:hypothetical protein